MTRSLAAPFPHTHTGRDRWVLAHRGPKRPLDPMQASAAVWEEERADDGSLAATAVVFLTNRECPFRCVMCDLWTHTLDRPVPPGAIARQIRTALAQLPPARHIKLYNAGSFFDPEAIPPADDAEIAQALDGFERVIVESHPAFLTGAPGARCLRFRDRLRGRLEVAIGLETAHRETLSLLNKRMTVPSFRRAAGFLASNGIALRVFLLLQPPFLDEAVSVEWACRSLDEAAGCGATACTVIPTRGGNGAMERLEPRWVPPGLVSLEATVEYGLSLGRGRVFADLWDIERCFGCACSARRAARLRMMNDTQQVPAPVRCTCTGGRRRRS